MTLALQVLRGVRGALYFVILAPLFTFAGVMLAAHVQSAPPSNPPSSVAWLFGSLALLPAVILAGWIDGPKGLLGARVLEGLMLLVGLSMLPAASRTPDEPVSQFIRWRGLRIRISALVTTAEERRSYNFSEAIEGYPGHNDCPRGLLATH